MLRKRDDENPVRRIKEERERDERRETEKTTTRGKQRVKKEKKEKDCMRSEKEREGERKRERGTSYDALDRVPMGFILRRIPRRCGPHIACK